MESIGLLRLGDTGWGDELLRGALVTLQLAPWLSGSVLDSWFRR